MKNVFFMLVLVAHDGMFDNNDVETVETAKIVVVFWCYEKANQAAK